MDGLIARVIQHETDHLDGVLFIDRMSPTAKLNVAEALDGLPPIKMHCSVLAAEALRITLADYYTRQGDVEKAAELTDEDVEEPQDSEEARQPLHWQDFGRMVRALYGAYPEAEPLDLSTTKLFKMILKLPGFDDDPHAAGEEQLEKLQMAWHEIKSG